MEPSSIKQSRLSNHWCWCWCWCWYSIRSDELGCLNVCSLIVCNKCMVKSRDTVSDKKRKPHQRGTNQTMVSGCWLRANHSADHRRSRNRPIRVASLRHYSISLQRGIVTTQVALLQLLYSIRSVCIDGVWSRSPLCTMLRCCMAAAAVATARIEDRAHGGCNRLESVCTQCKHFEVWVVIPVKVVVKGVGRVLAWHLTGRISVGRIRVYLVI